MRLGGGGSPRDPRRPLPFQASPQRRSGGSSLHGGRLRHPGFLLLRPAGVPAARGGIAPKVPGEGTDRVTLPFTVDERSAAYPATAGSRHAINPSIKNNTDAIEQAIPDGQNAKVQEVGAVDGGT